MVILISLLIPLTDPLEAIELHSITCGPISEIVSSGTDTASSEAIAFIEIDSIRPGAGTSSILATSIKWTVIPKEQVATTSSVTIEERSTNWRSSLGL